MNKDLRLFKNFTKYDDDDDDDYDGDIKKMRLIWLIMSHRKTARSEGHCKRSESVSITLTKKIN